MRLHRRLLLNAQWAIYARHLAASRRPILCGPWRSEVGFELLYWLPFLNAFRERYQIPKDRLIAIGRGGSAQWYDMAGTADLFEYVPAEAVRVLSVQASQQTGSLKQHDTPAWEQHVCGLVATTLGFTNYHILSPSWMYQLLGPFWEGRQPMKWLDGQILHRAQNPVPALPQALASQLPPRYIAMRWYTRATWPHREDLLLWTRRLVEAIASHIPVILIGSGFHADDHADQNLGRIPNVLKLTDLHPQTHLDNLAIQSAVIGRAKAYVGTYGGMAQGAMRWGVPTVAFYDQFGQTSPAHLTLSQSLSLQTGVPFIVSRPKDIEALLPLIANSGVKMRRVSDTDQLDDPMTKEAIGSHA